MKNSLTECLLHVPLNIAQFSASFLFIFSLSTEHPVLVKHIVVYHVLGPTDQHNDFRSFLFFGI